MAQPLGEAAQGYKVYTANQQKKNVGPVKTGVLKGIGYEGGRAGEVAAGQAKKDMEYAGVAKARQDDYHMLEQMGLLPGQRQPAPTQRRTSSGGGGGKAAAPKPVFDASPYAFDGAPFDLLMAAMEKGYGADQATANTAFDQLDQHLAGLSDPYAHIQPAQAAQVDPSQLSALMQSQGGNDAGLRAQAQFLQASNQSSASAQDRLAQMLSANQQAWNQSTQSVGQLARTGAATDLTATFNALKAKLEAQKLAGSQQMDRERMLALAAFNERNA